MNGPDQFETKLQRQASRPLPPAWRKEILNAARGAAASPRTERTLARPGSVTRLVSLLSTLNHQLSTVLWPHPKAWAGLAAAWLLVLAFNVAARDSAAPERASVAATPSGQVRQILREQEQLIAELSGQEQKPEVTPSKEVKPQPRSQAHEGFLNS